MVHIIAEAENTSQSCFCQSPQVVLQKRQTEEWGETNFCNSSPTTGYKSCMLIVDEQCWWYTHAAMEENTYER